MNLEIVSVNGQTMPKRQKNLPHNCYTTGSCNEKTDALSRYHNGEFLNRKSGEITQSAPANVGNRIARHPGSVWAVAYGLT